MNPSAILGASEHRAWPLPTGPWIMTQVWHELLFAHWPAAFQMLRPLIPSVLPLDTFEGECWVGIVPFHMTQVRPRGFPSIPKVSQFPELNVRTYVTVNDRPGVYFFSLDAGNPLAVALARALFHLPYYNADMSSQRIGDTIQYRSRRTHHGIAPAEFVASYRPIAPVSYAERRSLEFWLTERYYLYTTYHGSIYRGDIHHRLWPLQAAELTQTCNTMAQAHNIVLPDIPPLLHYSQRQEVLVWPLQRIH